MAASKPKYPLGSPQEHIEMCKTHDLPIDMLCEDCDEFICAKCAKTDHKEHEWNTIPTAAIQKRRGLLKFLTKIKEEDMPGFDEKIEKVSKQMQENKELCDSEIRKLQKHVDEVMVKLTNIQKRMEQQFRENLTKNNEKLDVAEHELNKKKKEIAEIVKYIEKNKNTMSDYGFIDNHRELTKMLSGLDIDIKDCKHSVRYRKGEISEQVLKNMIGNTLDLDDINLTETNSFKYGEEAVILMKAFCEDQCYVQQLESDFIEQVNRKGEITHTFNIIANELSVTDLGDVYFTDFKNNCISCLSPSGSVYTVINTDPLEPLGICQSINGGLLVTLEDGKSDRFKLKSHSRRLVRHVTVTGDVIKDYEYQEDGNTRLFTWPFGVAQNSNSDICIVNRTSPTTGELVIMSPSGGMKSVYRGQKLTGYFWPGEVVCDSHCNILVTDMNDIQIHLLSPEGEFLKFLLTENEVHHPTRLSFFKSMLWVGYREGLVKVFHYRV